jgi:hypothetical protein
MVVGNERPDRGLQLRQRVLGRIGIEDARVRLRDLRERPVRDPFSVRKAPALEDAAGGEPLDQLGEQPRLADSRRAEEGHELRRAFALHPGADSAQDRQFLVASHEWRGQAADTARGRDRLRRGGDRNPGRDRVALALGVHIGAAPVLDAAARSSLRALTD